MKKANSETFAIRKASLEEVFSIHQLIPEFPDKVKLDLYQERLRDVLHLAIVAESKGELVGFKVGYQSDNQDTFYSWMGGVVPESRKLGVAEALADYQEIWARERGFKEVFFKTRNRFPAMISFGLKRGFKIIEIIKKGGMEDYRIVMWKKL